MDILTVAELAVMLKMSKRQVYEMTRTRTRSGCMRENPIPVLKINGNLRFRKSDVEAWIEKLVALENLKTKALTDASPKILQS